MPNRPNSALTLIRRELIPANQTLKGLVESHYNSFLLMTERLTAAPAHLNWEQADRVYRAAGPCLAKRQLIPALHLRSRLVLPEGWRMDPLCVAFERAHRQLVVVMEIEQHIADLEGLRELIVARDGGGQWVNDDDAILRRVFALWARPSQRTCACAPDSWLHSHRELYNRAVVEILRDNGVADTVWQHVRRDLGRKGRHTKREGLYRSRSIPRVCLRHIQSQLAPASTLVAA